jgi:UDP-N-acetylglucosamine transferase subunit ALG13
MIVAAAGEKLRRKYRILVAPLDWGLGHATRCIPIITELLSNDCDVWLAGEGTQESLLRSEFPHLPFLPLEGYRIRYSKSKRMFSLKIISQIPRIAFLIRKEHGWLNKALAAHGFDAVISDNRFGLHHEKIISIFITHQLQIKSSLGKWSEKILRSWNYKNIDQFNECWVPDYRGEPNLAGQLSHPALEPHVPLTYVGLLSRMEKGQTEQVPNHLLFILSGPEPQRTILENKIIDDISHYPGTATVVRGLPTISSILPSTGMIKFYNHLPLKQLNEEMDKAEWIIGRSGYSTVMDIVKLGKKSILIPTPGQTEQEYLARHLAENHIAFAVAQDEFSLNNALDRAKAISYQFLNLYSSSELGLTVRNFLNRLSIGPKK